MLKPTIYKASLPLESEEDTLVIFGGVEEGITYGDGSMAESHFRFNRYLWEKAGKPDKIVVAFSADDFDCVEFSQADPDRSELAKQMLTDLEEAVEHIAGNALVRKRITANIERYGKALGR